MTKEITEGFRWQTMEGEILTLDQMETTHVFNSLKMIYNNTCPPEFRVGRFIEYRDIAFRPAKERRKCVLVFIAELSRRDDIPAWAMNLLIQMRDNMGKWGSLEGSEKDEIRIQNQ